MKNLIHYVRIWWFYLSDEHRKVVREIASAILMLVFLLALGYVMLFLPYIIMK